ncbi:MAG TPA: hypothetical protein VFV38_43530 [Ktedonobacteraceae bacterium]|nr:hypothetical protein [Ktedonobacteraceae bacterium]
MPEVFLHTRRQGTRQGAFWGERVEVHPLARHGFRGAGTATIK